MAEPWYSFPRIDNFGHIDSEGNYWKPDSNVQLPGYYPITAVLSGIITDVERTGYGQEMVTEKLNVPLNSLATHMFFEHMSDAVVHVGEAINPGQLLGHNNPAGQVPLGVGLYSGDKYGSGNAWNILQKDLAPTGANLLNPVKLLNQLKSGKPITGNSDSCLGCGAKGSAAYNECVAGVGAGVPPACSGVTNITNTPGLFPDISSITSFFSFLDNIDLKDAAIRGGIIIGAILLIMVGASVMLK